MRKLTLIVFLIVFPVIALAQGTLPNPTFGGTRGQLPPVLAPQAYNAYGDSNTGYSYGTACWYTSVYNCYVNRLAGLLGLSTVTNRAVTGTQAAEEATALFNYDSPTTTPPQPLRTLMIGTNDANYKGAGTYEATFNIIMQGFLSYATVPLSSKVVASTGSTTGTCATYPTFSAVLAEKCTASGSTITLSLTTTGGPIYIWPQYIDSDTGTWTYKIDSGSAVSVNTALSPAIATQQGGTTAPGLIRVAGIAPGTHTILFTQTNAGSMPIVAVGTPSNLPPAILPYLIVAGIPPQENGNDQAAVNAYNADILADYNALIVDGLNLYYAPVPAFVQGTSADMANQLHMNAVGHGEAFQAFLTAVPLVNPNGNSEFPTDGYFSTLDGFTQNQQVFAAVPATNAGVFESIYIDHPGPYSNIGYYVYTADNSANVYDIGGYGPGCYGSAANLPLAFHTGAQSGATLAPSTGFNSHSISAGPVYLKPGWYCVGYTGSAATNVMNLGGNTTSAWLDKFAAGTSVASVSSSGVFSVDMTAPATSLGLNGMLALWLY